MWHIKPMTDKPLANEVDRVHCLRLHSRKADGPLYTHMVVFSVLKDGYVHVDPYAWRDGIWVNNHVIPHPYPGIYDKDQARLVWNKLRKAGYVHKNV